MKPRAFCVGQAKSGTASLYGLVAGRYAAAHEPEREQLLDTILRESEGSMSPAEVASFLRARQDRLELDFDIAWANQFVVEHLVDVFPSARFIALFRDPPSWLGSMVGHLLSREIPPDVRAFLDWWFKPEEHPFGEGDEGLVERGLYSTRAFLSVWRRHVRRCVEAIPVERLLIVRTHELHSSHGVIADFLGIPWGALDQDRGHLNRGTWEASLDTVLDPTYVHDQIMLQCGDEMRRYFPEFS